MCFAFALLLLIVILIAIGLRAGQKYAPPVPALRGDAALSSSSLLPPPPPPLSSLDAGSILPRTATVVAALSTSWLFAATAAAKSLAVPSAES